MRKIFLSVFLLMSAFLVACADSEQQSAEETKEEPTPAIQEDKSNKPEKTETGQTVFTEAGQKGKVEGGTLELLKIKYVNESIDIAPIKVTLNEIKLFEMSEMTDEMKESMTFYNNNQLIGDTFNYVQITYESENTSDKNIGWYALSNAVTDTGQQIDLAANDFLYDDADANPATCSFLTFPRYSGFASASS